MTDTVSSEKRSQIMASVRSRGNKATEERLAEIFRHHRITGWRRHLPLPGKPDFTFRSHRVVVFIDGCFWHGCPQHLRIPQKNREYWTRKITRNQERDALVSQMLRDKGWTVLRLWEHELRDVDRIVECIRPLTDQNQIKRSDA